MSRKVNSLVLVGLLLVLLAGAYSLVYARLYRDCEALAETRRERETEYLRLGSLAARRQDLTDTLSAALDSLRDSPKVVLAEENSRVTYEYLNDLATVDGHHMKFAFVTGKEQVFDRYHTTEYLIEGEAAFRHLYAFLWKLEHYKRLYTIASLDWQEITRTEGRDVEPQSLVKYRLSVTGYGTGSPWSADRTLVDSAAPEGLHFNPFLPLVRDYIPPNTQDLLDVSHAQLQGLADDRAFVVDQHQELLVLRVGDPVYLGMLTEIDKAGRYVEFTLNKGGFIETAVLRLPQRR